MAELSNKLPTSVREAISRQISRRSSAQVISTNEVLDRVRKQHPDLPLTDREIIDQVADEASSKGIIVHFDEPSH